MNFQCAMQAISGLLGSGFRRPFTTSSQQIATNKKAGARPAFCIREIEEPGSDSRRSVLRDDRATPAVVQANSEQVDVLLDTIGTRKSAGG